MRNKLLKFIKKILFCTILALIISAWNVKVSVAVYRSPIIIVHDAERFKFPLMKSKRLVTEKLKQGRTRLKANLEEKVMSVSDARVKAVIEEGAMALPQALKDSVAKSLNEVEEDEITKEKSKNRVFNYLERLIRLIIETRQDRTLPNEFDYLAEVVDYRLIVGSSTCDFGGMPGRIIMEHFRDLGVMHICPSMKYGPSSSVSRNLRWIYEESQSKYRPQMLVLLIDSYGPIRDSQTVQDIQKLEGLGIRVMLIHDGSLPESLTSIVTWNVPKWDHVISVFNRKHSTHELNPAAATEASAKPAAAIARKFEPQAASRRLPAAAQEFTPQAASRRLPTAAQEFTPQAASRSLPAAAQEFTPQAASRSLPAAAQEFTPHAASAVPAMGHEGWQTGPSAGYYGQGGGFYGQGVLGINPRSHQKR